MYYSTRDVRVAPSRKEGGRGHEETKASGNAIEGTELDGWRGNGWIHPLPGWLAGRPDTKLTRMHACTLNRTFLLALDDDGDERRALPAAAATAGTAGGLAGGWVDRHPDALRRARETRFRISCMWGVPELRMAIHVHGREREREN